MTAPPADDEAAEPGTAATADSWVCGPCQRGKHRNCRSAECACCEGDPG